MREQHREQLEKIRAAVNDLTGAARYVESACPTGSSVIVSMRDTILRLQDEAEKDKCHFSELHGPRFGVCDKCGYVALYKMGKQDRFCPGCGREIERGSEGC